LEKFEEFKVPQSVEAADVTVAENAEFIVWKSSERDVRSPQELHGERVLSSNRSSMTGCSPASMWH